MGDLFNNPAPASANDIRSVALAAPDDFEGWRDAARGLISTRIAPEHVIWSVGQTDLFSDPDAGPGNTSTVDASLVVPRAFLTLARDVVCHSDQERFALLYTLLWRMRSAPRLTQDQADPLVRRCETLAKAVRRDIHKMRAFLRFREIDDRFVAWFEPDHHVLRANAGFFVRRFASMQWSILTPELSIHWDGHALAEAPGALRADAPGNDPVEAVWKSYYASIFNPARVKVSAMLKEMPKKYWKNMPESALIPELLAKAQARESGMIAGSNQQRTQPGNSLLAWEALRREASACTRCPLHGPATQTVFGEGPLEARLMFIGEQPGDQEDLAGRPFVGPAGQLFDRALTDAGIDRAQIYVSNAVKHFKFEQRGKRRIHTPPNAGEIEACRWWINQERDIVAPEVTIALGATAARSLFGKAVKIGDVRGQPHVLPGGGTGWVTIHPSYLLRLPDKSAASQEYARFVAELKMAQSTISGVHMRSVLRSAESPDIH